jgi:3-oxoacyl-[acyl-carrier-protein] synthase II
MTKRQVFVTGIGLITSIGEGIDGNWRLLQEGCKPRVIEYEKSGIYVHPLVATDFTSQIPNKMDQRRMGGLQASGAYAAGLALEDAGLKQSAEVLGRTLAVIGGVGGERDTALDERIFAEPGVMRDPVKLNQKLVATMRPSRFLSELPNLLAGNISILFGVTGGSRTMMGDELSGINALITACHLIRDGVYDVALVGGACNAERWDLILHHGFGQNIWTENYRPVWHRTKGRGGFIIGSMGVFLILESAVHARKRGKAPYCRVAGAVARHGERRAGASKEQMLNAWTELQQKIQPDRLGVMSGTTGLSRLVQEEEGVLNAIAGGGGVRGTGSIFGHGIEASFLLNVALAAKAVSDCQLYPPFQGDDLFGASSQVDMVIATGIGHSRGEAIAALAPAEC